MNVTYRCPTCDQTVRVPFQSDVSHLDCPACDARIEVAADAVEGNEVNRCLVCRDDDLFIRKNFSQRIGITIIVSGFVVSSIFFYFYMINWSLGVLFGTALLDLVLFLFVGNLLQCYRCHSEYRNVSGLDQREAFSLETHERYRQQAARLADQPPVGKTD